MSLRLVASIMVICVITSQLNKCFLFGQWYVAKIAVDGLQMTFDALEGTKGLGVLFCQLPY